MSFTFQQLAIADVVLVETPAFPDERGQFWETYKRSAFVASGIIETFIQDNFCRSVHGVLRGLHFQKVAAAQGKLVFTVRGEVFDVAVDIRRGSPTFGRYVSANLSEQNHQALYIPPGFAHGYCVLSDEAIVGYKTTAEYTPELDRGIVWNDPTLKIPWPIRNPILSGKDQRLPQLANAENNFVYTARPQS
ncbi:MAG: dTDP-4-dehydrorhamnose 3,5-epimerase [Verrucomicrobiia bacterium]